MMQSGKTGKKRFLKPKKKGLLLLFGDEMKYGKAFVLVAGLEGEDVGAGHSGT